MNCIAVANILDYFADDKLTERTAGGVRAHLKLCPRCAEEALLLQNMKKLLAGSGAPPLPERLRTAVYGLLRAETAPAPGFARFNWRLSPSYGFALAYAALLIMASFLSYGVPTQAFSAGYDRGAQGGVNG